MKKRLTSLFITGLILATALIGCSANKTESSSSKEKLKFATGGTTGTYYAYGGVLANTINSKNDNLNITVQSTGASKANIFLIDDNEADIAIVQNDVMHYAANGSDLFKDDGKITSFKAAAGLYAEVCQIITSEDIKSIDELKGKNVSVGDAGSGVEFNARQILDAYDISFDDIKVNNLGFGDSSNALKDGKIDAFFCTAGAPTTAITELCTAKKINILSIDDAHIEKLRSKYPFYTKYIVPAKTYKGVDNDIDTVAVKATIIVSEKLSDDTVYNIVKSIFDNKDEIEKSHATGKELDPKYALDGISTDFHEGAKRYFKECGVLK